MPKTQIVQELMTSQPHTVDAAEPVRTAARHMRDANVGAVLVENSNVLSGIVTDRDIAVRCVAQGSDPDTTTVGSVCSPELATLSPEDAVDDAIALMRKKAIRRIPVVKDGRPVGVLSLGDLAVARDPNSVLGGISGAEHNR